MAQFGFVLVLLRLLLDWYNRRPGHDSLALVVVLFALMIAEWVVDFKRADASDHSPYRSTPRITR